MIDKNYVKELCKSLYFEISDEAIDKFIDEVKDIQNMIEEAKKTVDPSISPVNYPRVVNCSQLRDDKPSGNDADKDYLSNAKVADKYVVGK